MWEENFAEEIFANQGSEKCEFRGRNFHESDLKGIFRGRNFRECRVLENFQITLSIFSGQKMGQKVHSFCIRSDFSQLFFLRLKWI